jgi:hypothetical protein
LVWRFFGHQIRVFLCEKDLEKILRRLWNHRPQAR